MNDIEEDSVQISLGDAIRGLNESEHEKDEKTRIHSLLIKEDSEVSRRTKQWCLQNKMFEKYSTKMTGQINGFRPKSRPFKLKAYSLTIQRMGRDHRGIIGWAFYEEAYIDFLRKEKVELTRLLELEESEGITSSDDLIKAVIEKSPKYNVTADDIKDLYENWYFKRNDEFEQWILGLKGIRRSLENKRHINEIESELENIKKRVSSINENIASENESKDDTKLLKLQIKKLQDKVTIELKDLQFDFKNQITNRAELSEKINKFQYGAKAFTVELNNLKSDLEKLKSASTDYMDEKFNIHEKKYKSELSELVSILEQKIHMNDIDLPQNSMVNQLSSDFNKTNKTILRVAKNIVETHIGEEQFLVDFRDILASSELESTNKISTLNHCILKCSDVICCQSLAVVDPWIRTLNWEQHVLEAAVDPSWTNYSAWQDVSSEFLSNPDIRFLILHSYNSGYVEGYLKPYLLLFRRENHTNKKIILVETCDFSSSPPTGIGLALIENHRRDKLNTLKDVFERTDSVALKSFNEWMVLENEEAEEHASDICQELIKFMANENIIVHETELLGLYHIICAYIGSGLALDQKTKILLLTTFLSNLWEEEFVTKFIGEI